MIQHLFLLLGRPRAREKKLGGGRGRDWGRRRRRKSRKKRRRRRSKKRRRRRRSKGRRRRSKRKRRRRSKRRSGRRRSPRAARCERTRSGVTSQCLARLAGRGAEGRVRSEREERRGHSDERQ